MKKANVNLIRGLIIIIIFWGLFFLLLFNYYRNYEDKNGNTQDYIREHAGDFALEELLHYTPIITSFCLCLIVLFLFLNYLRSVNSDVNKNEGVVEQNNNDEKFLKSSNDFGESKDDNALSDEHFEKEIDEDDVWNVDTS